MENENTERFPCVQRGDYFIGKISNMSRMQEIETIKSKLEMFGLKREFEDSCFGFLLTMHEIEFTGPLVHHLLMMQDREQSGKEFKIVYNGRGHRFGYEEFALITGMKFTSDDNLVTTESRLKNEYFRRDNVITRSKLIEVFKRLTKNTDRDDVLRLSLIVALEIILLGEQKSQGINISYLSLVEDFDRFNSFPWGKVVYEFTIRRMRSSMVNRVSNAIDKNCEIEEEAEEVDVEDNVEEKQFSKSYPSTSYNLYGFPLALQVWAYEAIPALVGDLVCKRSSDQMPRILNWENKKPGRLFKFKYLDSTYFSTKDLLVLKVLVPTDKEKDSLYYQSNVVVKRGMPVDVDAEVDPNFEKIETKGKEKFAEECQASSSTTPIDKVMEEVLVVKQEVKEIKQMLVTILDVLHKGKHNVTLDSDGISQSDSPLRADFCGDMDDEIGIKFGSPMHKKSSEDVIVRSEEDVEKVSHDQTYVKDTNLTRLSGEEQHLPMSLGVAKNDDSTSNEVDHVDTSTIALFAEDKNLQIICLEEELQKKNLAVDGYEIEVASNIQSEDLHGDDTDSCIIVSAPTETKKYYTRKQRSVGPLLKSPYEEYKKNKRKRKASNPDQGMEDVLHSTLSSYYNVHKQPPLDKYLAFISWLHNSSSNMVDSISVGCPSTGRANAIWFHRLFKNKTNLFNSHIDCGLWLLRKKFHMYPQKFSLLKKWSTMDSYFFHRLLGHFEQWKKSQSIHKQYDWISDGTLTRYVLGSIPEYGIPWYEIDTLYGVVCYNDHWIVLEFDLADQEIHVFDSLPKHIREAALKKHLSSIALLFPDFIRSCGVYESRKHGTNFNLKSPWNIFRNVREKVPVQESSGDCGIYCLKFVEYRITRNPICNIKDEDIILSRKKMGYELFYSLENELLL